MLVTTLTVLCLALATAACSHGTTQPDNASSLRYVVVRHAEKNPPVSDADKDPSLTQAGHQRALRLARSLDGADVVAVYSTPYQRTRQTAVPTAQAHALPVIDYDASEPAPRFVSSLRKAHQTGTVLVVGHSNTVPAIVAALCGCDVAPMTEAEYSHRFIVDVDANGQARMMDSPLPE